jgi:hypothetical protein
MLDRQAGMRTRLATLSDLDGWGGRVYDRGALAQLAAEIDRRITTLNERVQDALLASSAAISDQLMAEVDVLCGALLEQHELLGEVTAELQLLQGGGSVHPRARHRR